MNKYGSLEKAVEITKEYARSGNNNGGAIEDVLERLYQKLNSLSQEVNADR